MAFRKRNVAVNVATLGSPKSTTSSPAVSRSHAPGTKPSLSGSSFVTSTGTAELDNLLGGYGGLVLGCSLLVGEHGATDYAGALLRAYVAEGLLQGHEVHIVGAGKAWAHNLPGLAVDGKAGSKTQELRSGGTDEKMKIAWRYESLGRAGERVTPPRQAPNATAVLGAAQPEVPFCHTFDLTKRFEPKASHKINYLAPSMTGDTFAGVINELKSRLGASSASTVHRIVVPLLLSPAYYPPSASQPKHVLRFIQGLRTILQRHSSHATAMLSIPLSLYPQNSGLTHWMQHLSNGVLELVPFPYVAGKVATGASKKDAAQGMLRVLRLPVISERGEGGAGGGNSIGDDLSFTLSRRKFAIEAFSLPPMEGDQEAQSEAGKLTAKDVEF